MPPQIVIFATDKIRGGIMRTVLRQNGHQSILWTNSVTDLRDTLDRQAPVVAIIDTHAALPAELSLFRDLCLSSQQGCLLLLGRESVIDAFPSPGSAKLIRLHDPLDPMLIVEHVTACFHPPQTRGNRLEEDLKQFLGLI